MKNFDVSETIFKAIKNLEMDFVGLSARRYSGRGMYGRQCLGFETSNMIRDTAKIVSECAVVIGDILEGTDGDESDINDLSDMLNDITDAFENVSWDNMGLDMIVYFPQISWDEEWEESEIEEDEDND